MCARELRRVQRTFEDLTTLEVNTIVKPTINSGKVEDKDHLILYQLAGTYYAKIVELGNKYEKGLTKGTIEPNLTDIRPEDNLFLRHHLFKAGGIFSFRELGIWANFGSGFITAYGDSTTIPENEQTEDKNMLLRIESLCLGFSGVLENLFEQRNKRTLRHKRGPIEPEPKIIDTLWDTFKEHQGQSPPSFSSVLTKMADRHHPVTESGKYTEQTGTYNVMNVYYSPTIDVRNHANARKNNSIVIPSSCEIEWYELENWSDVILLRSAQSRMWNLTRRYIAAKRHGLYTLDEHSREVFIKSAKAMKLKLDFRDWIYARKMLDIGTETVYLQTKIGIDGDITTRVAQKFADKPIQFMLDMHNGGINMSVRFWDKIVDALQSLVSGLLSRKDGKN